MTRGLVFTLWNTSFIIFIHLKLVKVHFLTLFFDSLVIELLHVAKNTPLQGPTHPHKSTNCGSTGPNFEIPSKAHESI